MTESGSNMEAPSPWLPEGTIIEGKFRLVRLLATGGWGQVFLAHDGVLDREVAIKLLPADIGGDDDHFPRFVSEARTMARIRHENVVVLYSAGQHDKWLYLAMEYVPGVNLQRWLEDRGPLPLDEAHGILAQLCRGLQAIHGAGAVHRDIKPANVLVASGFRMVLSDFGLARPVFGPHQSNAKGFKGTPRYSAPENAFGSSQKHEELHLADIYSLGVIAFELLAGRTPFDEATHMRMVMAHVTEQAEPLTSLRPDLPASVAAAVASALSKAPSDRPQSASEFLAMFEADIGGPTSRRAVPFRVLLADDDPTFRLSGCSVLRGAFPKSSVECAEDGQQALDALDREAAEIAVLDLKMPKLNGLEVAAALRASRRKRTRVIVVSAVGAAPDWNVLRQLGVDAFLVKPVSADELIRTVERLLALESVSTSNASR